MENKNHVLERVLACVMVVIMTLTAVPLSGFVGLELPKLFETTASAYYTEGYLEYAVENGEATITGHTSSISGALVIPNTLGGYPVRRIGNYAFRDCTGLTEITIPDSVTSIGEYAFRDCTGLTDVIIGNGVTSIGDYAFKGCTGLTKINWNAESVSDFREYSGVFYNTGTSGSGIDVVFGDNVKRIPTYAFYTSDSSYRPKIKSVTIGNSVTSIGGSAFRGCTGLTSITIPDSVTSIGGSAFTDTAWYNAQPFGDVYAGKVYYEYKGTMLENTSVVIKDGTKGIAGSAFSGCNGLTGITIPDSVTSICDGAFSYCSRLTSITIPDSVTSIGNYAFSHCSRLTSITIPDSVTSIGNYAFSYCSRFTSITIPDSVTSLGEFAFGNCPLTTIRIGKNVKTIEKYAFSGIKSIPEVYYAGSEEDWKNISIDQSNDMILRATMYYNADITHTHSYTSTITKKASCTESGVKTFTCDCGKTYTEEIPATGHKTSSWITDKAATCTAGGTRHKECTVCKTVLSTGTIAAKGHSFVSNITAATCTSIGYETKTCKTCGECHFVRKIPATGHTLKTAVTPATQTESGLSITSCKTCGTITKATLIKQIASVTLSKTAFTYNGKVQTPTVVVKDSAGKVLKYKTDYTVSYASGRKTPGKYAVKITFKGYYAGTKTLYFTIAPATPTLTVTAGAKKAALKWNKQVGATGYVVYMATSKTGKYSRIAVLKGNSAVSYTKTGLTTGKTYYFKVAAYTTSGGSNIYSAFSAVKGIKVK